MTRRTTLLCCALAATVLRCERAEPVATAEAAKTEPAAAARSAPARFEAYVEPVALSAAAFSSKRVNPFGADFAHISEYVVENERNSLLRLSNLELLPFPPWVGDAFGEQEAPAQAGPGWRPGDAPIFEMLHFDGHTLAQWRDDRNEEVRFQFLRSVDSSWELAGRFELPPRAVANGIGGRSRVAFRLVDGRPYLELSDQKVVMATASIERTVPRKSSLSSFEFDSEKLSWNPVPARPIPIDDTMCAAAPETMEGEDLVRWGQTRDEPPRTCIAARRTVNEPWVRLSDPRDFGPPLLWRKMERIDATRVLVTSGIGRGASGYSRRVDVVDLAKMEVRDLGDQTLGWPMELPADGMVWMRSGEITRFDAGLEKFSTESVPDPGFAHQWAIRIDERTMLLGADAAGYKAHFAKIGFRPVP